MAYNIDTRASPEGIFLSTLVWWCGLEKVQQWDGMIAQKVSCHTLFAAQAMACIR